MSTHFTNAHIHIFVSECAPPNFLRVNSFRGLKYIAKPVKSLLEIPDVRKGIWKLNKKAAFLSRYRRLRLDRVISFLNIGAQLNQRDVFIKSYNSAKSLDSYPRLIVHTLDMDYMDTNSKPIITYLTQLHEVLQIKEDYPDNIFPFVSADPRAKSGMELVKWIEPYFKNGVKSKVEEKILPFCSGIKLYPAHGFFPFDQRLDELYEFAEKHNIPLMFHCTREGSQYIGKEIENLIPRKPKMIMPDEKTDLNKVNPSYEKADSARAEILCRIDKYYEKKSRIKKSWIRNNKHGINEYACDLFSHPQNYIPIMSKYPKLKICVAHMGGATEVEFMNVEDLQTVKSHRKLKKIWKKDGYNWASLIKTIMKEYPCFFTDISSTITHLDDEVVAKNIQNWLIEKDINENELGNRVLFGTDFFMTESQHNEPELYGFMQSKLEDWFDKMAGENIDNYLK